MSDLIERVAKAANWTFDFGCHCWLPAKGSVTFYADDDALLDAGLVFLLRELLDAGWHAGKEGDRFLLAAPSSKTIGGPIYVFHFGSTLEEAAMLAFLHKGER